jgi:hypothetical protein
MSEQPKGESRYIAVSLLRSTRELLRRICRLHHRSPAQQIAFWTAASAAALGLIESDADVAVEADDDIAHHPWAPRPVYPPRPSDAGSAADD